MRSSEITLPLLRAAGVTGMYLEFYVAPSDRNIGDLLIQFDRLRDIDVQVQWGLWGVTAVRSFLRVLRDSLPCLERATVPIPINCDLGADHVCVSGEDVAVLCALREGRSIELHGVLIFAPREALSDPQCARILATLLTSSETIATPWSQLSWWGPSNNMEAWVVWSHLTPGACGRKDCYRVEPSRDRVRTVKAPAVFIAEWIDISRFDTEWPILGPRVTELVWTGGYLEALLSVNVKLIDAADQQRVPAEGQVAFSAPDLLVRIITCAPDSYNAAAIHRRLVALHIFLPSARLAIVSGTPSRIRG